MSDGEIVSKHCLLERRGLLFVIKLYLWVLHVRVNELT